MGHEPIVFKVSPGNALFDKLAVSAAKEKVTPAVIAARILSDYFKSQEATANKLEEIKERTQKLTYEQLLRFLKLLENRTDKEFHKMKISELAHIIKTIAQSIKDKQDNTQITITNNHLTVAILNRRDKMLKGKKAGEDIGEVIETTAEPC